MRLSKPGIGAALASVIAAMLILSGVAQAAEPPLVKATWVSEVKATSANLRGEINPQGISSSYRFEYLTEAAYQANRAAIPPKDGFSGALKAPSGAEPSLGSGEAALAVVQHIGALKPASGYRYRIVATNGDSAVTIGPTRVLNTQENAPLFSLPDSRGWEMVSPIDKGGGAVAAPGALFGGGVPQAAADGNTSTFGSSASFANPQGAPGASQYLSHRSPSGWSTEDVTVPTLSGAYGDHPDGVPYQLFSSDLARGLHLNGRRCAEAEECPRSYSLRESAGGALTTSPEEADLAFVGASADLKHIVLSTCDALTADATEAPGVGGSCDPAEPNLYRWLGAGLDLINLLPGDAEGTPGATLAAQSQAISSDGSRVYFKAAGNLYLRNGAQTVQVDAAAEVGGGGVFETAAVNGSVVFFSKGGHLYRYDLAGEVTTDLTPAGGVQGVLGASDDGSYLYYATASGLFLRYGATTTSVASDADPSSYLSTTGAARVSSDGTHLAFLSSAELSPYDNNGQSEVYLYDATGGGGGTLTCVSCNPSGERPQGPASIPPAIANGQSPLATRVYKPRALSANGSRLFFDTFDALALQDTNADRDVYQWEAEGTGGCAKPGGCINLISSGRSEEGASFIDASADGSDAFFLTDGSLVPQDPGSVDLYDARVGGGFPSPPTPIPCLGDACQPLPPEPEDPGPGTLFAGTSPNPAAVFPKAKHKKHHHHHHHHKKKPHKGHAKHTRRAS